MLRYIKKQGDIVVEAPEQLISTTRVVAGYNHESNEEMLIADGYIRYEGINPLSYVDIVDGEIIEKQYPPVSTVRQNKMEQLYQMKCDVAYTGITIVTGDAKEYLFETNSTAITMANSVIMAMNSLPEDTEVSWKVYEGNEAAFLNLTLSQIKKLFAEGMNIINQAFAVEAGLWNEFQAMSDTDVVNSAVVAEFDTKAREQFDAINKKIDVDTL